MNGLYSGGAASDERAVTLFIHVFVSLYEGAERPIENHHHGRDFVVASVRRRLGVPRHGMEHAGLHEARTLSDQAVSRYA